MRPNEQTEIRSLPLFRTMGQAAFDRLLKASYVQSFPAGLVMIQQGEPADFLHILLEGQVELFSAWAEHEATMAVLAPMGTFILAATIRDAPYLMSARTIERSRIALIPSAEVRAIFAEDPAFALAIIQELAGCYRAVVRNAKGLKLRNSRERIAAYMLRQSRKTGNARGFSLSVEKRVLASYLGMTAENLSRSLRAMEADGLKVDGARVTITDPDRLMALARLDPLMDGPDAMDAPDGPP